MPTPLIVARGLHKSYREAGEHHTVLESVDLEIHEGEIVVLLGRSGSGKSTLLNLLGGLDRPDRGSLQLRGRELVGLSETELTRLRRRELGFVFQFFNLIPTLTVWENLLLPLQLNGTDSAATRHHATHLLHAVGLADRLAAYPDRLSGGEQQRVAIARALVHSPHIVLADEPTGNLDTATARTVLDLLDRLVRAEGRTLIMATHSAEVIGVADRVLRVNEGRIEPAELEAARP
jgi:putative ABC transport system ATP-binding protein